MCTDPKSATASTLHPPHITPCHRPPGDGPPDGPRGGGVLISGSGAGSPRSTGKLRNQAGDPASIILPRRSLMDQVTDGLIRNHTGRQVPSCTGIRSGPPFNAACDPAPRVVQLRVPSGKRIRGFPYLRALPAEVIIQIQLPVPFRHTAPANPVQPVIHTGAGWPAREGPQCGVRVLLDEVNSN